ncbi:MAG: hypothetical protein H6741_25620 [Alphaproteobacteria bacterium]|nr:hypothetical protein [Alphaproteobacteria bacterium]MCB9796090.1 hypothetical protein [Alphaproteobacteria bacterium]
MPRPASPTTALLLALVLIEALATLADLRLGPWATVPPEALYNARAGLMVACGHGDALWEMQYRSFCGGCSAEALMAAPLFKALGPTTLAWRLTPAALHLVVVVGAAAWAFVGLGARGAALVILLMMGAPGFYRELALSGFGNHAESSAFPLLAAALLVAPGPRGLTGALAGLFAGLGLWFCYTSAHALPALALLAALGGAWRGAGFVVGLPLGALPWWLYHRDRADAIAEASTWWTSWEIASPGMLGEWLFGGFVRQSLWPAAEHGAPGALPDVWWALCWGLAALGLALGLAAARRAPRRLYPGLALLTLLAAYALRLDLWDDSTQDPAAAAFLLRYRAPLIPLLALNVAAAAALARRGAGALTAAALCLALTGVGLRVGQWRHAPADAPLLLLDGEPDRTLPSGRPPVRLRRQLGRPADVRAALEALDAHEDPLPACRALHVQELGRRLGLGLAGGGWPGWGEDLSRAWARAQQEGAPEALAVGLAAGVEERSPQSSLPALARPFAEESARARAAIEALPLP